MTVSVTEARLFTDTNFRRPIQIQDARHHSKKTLLLVLVVGVDAHRIEAVLEVEAHHEVLLASQVRETLEGLELGGWCSCVLVDPAEVGDHAGARRPRRRAWELRRRG